jgi:hypothetical protein
VTEELVQTDDLSPSLTNNYKGDSIIYAIQVRKSGIGGIVMALTIGRFALGFGQAPHGSPKAESVLIITRTVTTTTTLLSRLG